MRKIDKSINMACGAALFSGMVTLIVSIMAGFGYNFAGFTIWSLFDALFIFSMAFGIYKKSRICAILIFFYWIINIILNFVENGNLPGLAMIWGYFYFHGICGTFGYHKHTYRQKSLDKPPRSC